MVARGYEEMLQWCVSCHLHKNTILYIIFSILKLFQRTPSKMKEKVLDFGNNFVYSNDIYIIITDIEGNIRIYYTVCKFL